MADLTEEVARLRERQGAGARYDADAAPAKELLWARRGTAYFARKLNELTDEELDGATLIPRWSRRRLIAHVGYQARTLSQIVEAARTGDRYEPISEPDRTAQIDLGETLPARALRNLFFHSEVHLNVEWRDLRDADWDAVVVDMSGKQQHVRDTPFIRACAVWIHAVDLDNHGSFHDFPPDLLDAVIAEKVAMMGRDPRLAHLKLFPTDRQILACDDDRSKSVSGAAADLARWLCGRGARRLVTSSDVLDLIRPHMIPGVRVSSQFSRHLVSGVIVSGA